MVALLVRGSLGWLLAVPAAIPLSPGAAPIERELKTGEIHLYEIELRQGEYLQAVIEQLGVNVKATVKGPDGSVVFVADGPAAPDGGPEPIALVASAAGRHEMALERSGRLLPPSRYSLSVEAVRPPTEEDLRRVAAARATNEGCAEVNSPKPNAARALERLREARAGWQALGDRRMQMWVENHLGYVTSTYLDRLDESAELYSQGLATARQMGDEFGEAYLLLNLAEIQRKRGLLDEALRNVERARELYRASGRTFRETRALLVLGAIGNVSGDLQRAFDHLREALQRYEEADDAAGRSSARLNLGNTYLRMGEYELAAESYQQALKDVANDQASRAFLTGQMGVAFFHQADYPRARAAYLESLAAYKALRNRVREASIGIKLATLDREEGNLQAARDAFAAAATVMHEGTDSLGEAQARCQLGETERQLGNQAAAQAAYDEARRLTPEWHVTLRLCLDQGLARLAVDGGDLAQARAHAERALETAESLRASVEGQRSRGAALAATQAVYELLIEVRMGQHAAQPSAGHDAAAFEVSERARARSLLELLAEGQLDIRRGVDPALLAEERSLRHRLNAQAQAQEQAISARNAERAEALGREIAGLTTRLAEIETRVRRENPAGAALAQPEPLGMAEIQRQVLDADTVLLEYALGEKGSQLWIVSREGLATRRLAAREVIEKAARRLHEAASAAVAGRGTAAERSAAWSAAAEELGRLVLPPDLGRIAARRLLVVAPGALQYVPFAALPLAGAETMLSRFEVVNAPSASVVATLRDGRAAARPPGKVVAVFADPVFDRGDPRVRTAVGQGAAPVPENLARALRSIPDQGQASLLSRLPFSRQEADAILAGAPRKGSLRAVGFDANREAAMSAALADYRIVHFATHGLLNTRQPELSGVVLSLVDRQGRRQDGFLRLHDVYNLRLGAELVVLSGCQTGLGKDMRGEGLQGLTRGFMYAGAPRVVASLWQVDDLATAELMKRFYKAMFVDELPPAAALRAAQRHMASTRTWQAPYHWAAFGLHGDWR
jgi:CHAT domain-containing protein/tetratricopeptide (TPR) repeat protein